jgi:hypothetical protein
MRIIIISNQAVFFPFLYLLLSAQAATDSYHWNHTAQQPHCIFLKKDCKYSTMQDWTMEGVPPGMPKMTPHEWVAVTLNPLPILVRSRLECGLEGRG